MNSLLTVLIVVTLITLIVSGGFYTDACRRLGQLSERKTNHILKSAYELLIASSVITWLLLVFLLGAVIYYYVEYVKKKNVKVEDIKEHAEKFASGHGLIIVLGVSSFILLIMGILTVDAADKIKKSGVSSNNGSYTQSLIGGVMALCISLMCLVISIGCFWHKSNELTRIKAIMEVTNSKSSDPTTTATTKPSKTKTDDKDKLKSRMEMLENELTSLRRQYTGSKYTDIF